MKQLSDTVRVDYRGRVAVIIVDNPPVNTLTPSVRGGVLAAITGLQSDGAVDAVVLHCAGSTFIAGADLRAMNRAAPKPSTAEVARAIELSSKPVVAALHGNALGGGLELAVGCHHRCAMPGTKLGAPEIHLGLIPGAGGTQRLPRLIGFSAALEMILSGAPVDSARALQLGLIDEIVGTTESVLDHACELAERVAGSGTNSRRTSDRPVSLTPEDERSFEAAIATHLKHGTELARVSAIEAVRAAADFDFANGSQREADLFAACRDSSESRALRHLFLAERDSGKLQGESGAAMPRSVQRVAVIGAGTMGRGIALAFAAAGFDVTLLDTDDGALKRAMQAVDDLLSQSVTKGRLTADQRIERLSRIHATVDRDALRQVDLAIEAVFEDLSVKHEVFRELDTLCRRGTVLATNTSALDIDEIATATSRPEDVVGLHFFSPANVMRLVEIVRGRATSPDVIRTSMDVVKRLRKLGVLAGNCDGFIGNRMLIGYRREAEYLLLEGASPAQVDAALKTFGMAMGPFAVSDLAGLDIGAAGRARRRAAGTGSSDPRFGAIGDRLVELGRLGQKTQRGYFRHEAGNRTAIEDPVVHDLIVAEAARLGIERRVVSDAEIVQRCVLALINEGARIVAEQIAQRPGDVDLVWVNGYGFPKLRGGPMQYADSIGLPTVLQSLRTLAATFGAEDWNPAPLIETLAASHRSFDDLNQRDDLKQTDETRAVS